ncbi:MAG: T9SS type A sorting domain-containing protein [Candidatus Cloacimonetes bacterium]|nr:T9SS type A sorting domain-containing protein [Candidatus Cloacimonadota bacterium]
MKKLVALLVFASLVFGLYADFMKPIGKKTINRDNVVPTRLERNHSNQRVVPAYEFITPPVSLMENYFDYMSGAYNSTPIRIEEDGSVYLTFHAKETADGYRRIYYAYIDAAGNVINCSTIGSTDSWEGYPGIDLDPETGDPFVAWHANADTTSIDMEVVCSYDTYHNIPGFWMTLFIVIDDDIPSANGTNDHFIWPDVYIGPSPEAGKRRIYIVARNYYFIDMEPSENPMIAYADFNIDDITAQSTLDWTYITIPIFDDWSLGIPEIIRPFYSFDISKVDGTLAFFGYKSNNEIFICSNADYGEGDWTYISEAVEIDTWNPQNLDGTYFYLDDNGDPYELCWAPFYAGHMTSRFYNGSNNMVMEINMGLKPRSDSLYFDYEIFPYIFKYDFTTEDFDFIVASSEVNTNAANPNYEWGYNECYIPWDTDNDGEVDEYNPDDGSVLMYNDWPIYYWLYYLDDQAVAFHENLYKVAINDDKGWIVHIWQNGLYSKYYNDAGDDDYIDWATVAEIYIVASGDGGQTWSEPIIMNAKSDDVNFEPAFTDMMPVYFYLGDKIEDLGNNWGKLHLMFLDDNSFGSFSSPTPQGTNQGGYQYYASFKLDFSELVGRNNNTVAPAVSKMSQNYPNPFNPTTTIEFGIEAGETGTLTIFNILGQKVLSQKYESGFHTFNWDASKQASGVYFYQLKTDKYFKTNKMLMLK